ncbi:PQQ-like beta-propeller repeat protein [candidate division KSB1 bacterium]|nr:PQQ-like beta-propeller repeat protein [candidate division KSB1 bacterium]
MKFVSVFIFFATLTVAQDIAQWRGPERTGSYPDKNLLQQWPADGAILFSFDYADYYKPTWHPEAPFINCNSPIYHDGFLFVTSGYNHVAVKLQISPDASAVEPVWHQPVLDTHHGGVVLVDEYLYGSTWIDNNKGNWACVDWNSGEVKYEQEWETKGPIIAADGNLIVYDEKRGNVALVKATPDTFQVICSFRNRQGKGPHWAHPSIDKGRLYVRHGDTVQAFQIGR